METTGWLRQADKPLFEDLLWSRPQNKRSAGKLLLIGGHSQSFSAISKAFSAATKAGAGSIRVLLPASLQKTLGRSFTEAEFAPSTPIGSFSQAALGLALELAEWADGVLLAGDFGRNSETAIMLDKFLRQYKGQLTIAEDSLDYFYQEPVLIAERSNTVLVAELPQLQKLARAKVVIRQNDDFMRQLESIQQWSMGSAASCICRAQQQIIVASGGRISSTKSQKPASEVELAAYASVWMMQQPSQLFEALTTAAYCFSQ